METTSDRHDNSYARRVILHLWPVGILAILCVIIVTTNTAPGNWLLGWDNLVPEFDVTLNIHRSLFAVWQEYQGLGLLGGMGHASALPREIFIWMLTYIFPVWSIRWIYTYLMLFVGSTGAYILASFVIRNRQSHIKPSAILESTLGLSGGVFYLANLATVQAFRAPFEAFITHYAALPWLLVGALIVFQSRSKTSLILFTFLSFVFSTQAYIPTLFLVYAILLTALCIHAVVTSAKKAQAAKWAIVLVTITACVNAYWLIPAAYFTITSSSVTVNAKINQMATSEVFLRNQKFGTISDTLTLHNFWFDNTEYNPSVNAIEPMMKEWKEYESRPLVKAIQITVALLIVFGALAALLHPSTALWTILGAIGFTMVANDMQPFTSIVGYLRDHVPLLAQFFRFPFTKWGTALSLSYAVLFTIAIEAIIDILKKPKTLYSLLLIGCIALLPIISTAPQFTGHLISDRVIVKLPNDYVKLFSYMQTKPNGRIANLPQQSFWDWKYYAWGNLGSGFMWYGLKQPVIDRAFDVWSAQDENYYWELSQALYTKNATRVQNTLEKYAVSYVLMDESVVSASNNRSLIVDETKHILDTIPSLHKLATFGSLTLYERATNENEFISIKEDLPIVNAYTWTDRDIAHEDIGDYIASIDGKSLIATPSELARNDIVMYPFRSLFTKRSVKERAFTIEENETTILLNSEVTATGSSIIKSKALVYDTSQTDDLKRTSVTRCGQLKTGSATAEEMIGPGAPRFVRLSSEDQRGCISIDVPTLSHLNGYIAAVTSRHIQGRPLTLAFINNTDKHTELEVYLDPKRIPGQARDDNGGWQTDYFVLPPLARDGLGYTLYLANDAIGSHPTVNDIASIRLYTLPYEEMVREKMRFGNRDSGIDENEIASSSALGATPRNDPSAGSGQAPSAGSGQAPSAGSGQAPSAGSGQALLVQHPNPAFYRVEIRNPKSETRKNETLILSQSFDKGWIAVTPSTQFPYLVPAGRHVMVNNWENGWVLEPSVISRQSSDCLKAESCSLTAIIFFWPQILEWIGFFLLPLPFFFILKKK